MTSQIAGDGSGGGAQEQFQRASYAPPPDAPTYDELWMGQDLPRPHQELLHRHLTSHSPDELEQVRRVVLRRITEQEVTFNILGVPEGTNRPWQLDSIPHVLDHAEWQRLERGLQQRARLINQVLEDCYGEQRLIRSGALPAGMVLGHPDFLRACHGWQPIGGARLLLHGVDLGRSPDGSYRVFSDRPSALIGAGYALENRLVIGRALSELFRGYAVQRVSHFFGKVRSMVDRLAPHPSIEPRVVLLSAGDQDESAFEHAYLSRYLGYELVEGRDLTVRGDAVFLKTLTGLQQVDVILRRVDDRLSDPLFLREDSAQGVPGLVTAARIGAVGLANPLGASLAAAPALKAYLPRLARELLGEDLAIQTVHTLWCGDEESLGQVLPNLERFLFKPAFADRRGEPLRPATMSADQREEFSRRLQAQPAQWVAEEWPTLSVAPLWNEGSLSRGHVAFRTFMCRDEDDYCVMPGGLARVDSAPDGLFLSLRSNRASKDVWVPSLAHSPESQLPTMPDKRVELRRGGVDLPSRLLDDVYWLGRYVERADVTARLIRAGLERIGSEAGPDAPRALEAVMTALRKLEVVPKAVNSENALHPNEETSSIEALLLGPLFDRNRPAHLRSILDRIHFLTLSVRSRLSRDAWHVLRQLTASFEDDPDPERRVDAAIAQLDRLLLTSAAVSGTVSKLVRGHVWLFLDMGRRVELGGSMLSLIDVMLPAGASRVHLEALLDVADSLLTYRARYLSSLQVAPVVDLLLTDDSNPRSVAFQVSALTEHIRQLPKLRQAVRSRAERRIIELKANLLTVDVEQACSGDGSGLRTLLEDSNRLLWQFSDDVSHTWFSHANRERSLVAPVWVDEDLEGE